MTLLDHRTDSGFSPEHITAYRERVFHERTALRRAFAAADTWPERVLADLLDFNAATEYGKAHGFRGIRTLDDFRKAVPVQDYAAHAPWIERMAAGEHNLLTADDPAVFFTSSGSTGSRKKIPVTPRFVRTTFLPFFYAAWAPLAEHFPEVLGRADAVLNLKHDPLTAPPTTASGRPHVGASQVDFGERFGEPLSAEPGTRAPWSRLPVEVDADDHLHKMYLRLRLAVEADVQCIIGINPAMVAAVPFQLRQWWPRIVREVHDGTVDGRPYTTPNPDRARALERMADWFGTLRPAHVWPRLRVIFCWSTGLASLYLPALREEFGPSVTVLPAPIAASEGPTGVALGRHPRAGSLVVTAAVHEFVPADQDLEPDSRTLAAHDLEPGHDYHVIFSHVGGLYRYAVGDVVRVVDRVDGVPRVEYAGRAGRSNAVGERLRDAEVVRALATALAAGGLTVTNAACRVTDAESTGSLSGTGPAYRFALGTHQRWSDDEIARLAGQLDAALADESRAYRAARADGRLTAPTVRPIDAEAFHRDWQADVAAGVRPTQVKDRLFRQAPEQWQRLTGEQGSNQPASAQVAATNTENRGRP
ncbi:GH3 family domain-containing protein [Nocardia iowensis]|uniref:GH3 auxin-responsive promoter family protein n=1 Tax=Nocardia iowensis TaxID=204891 RepID=A0ABX8RPP2_NOCIO|nr:GH3 auxin-responsive promoter family protein [Nocardia iowensis]QXN89401.1 GH3 auxin-responsive promoter family protein [Nocardia iowensis]